MTIGHGNQTEMRTSTIKRRNGIQISMDTKKESFSVQKSGQIYGSFLAFFNVCSVLCDWLLYFVCPHGCSLDS